MRTFVRIEGEDKEKGIGELEKLAVDMPKICIRSTSIDTYLPSGGADIDYDPGIIGEYFSRLPVAISYERCSTIISKSDIDLGEYDFYFEWINKPNGDMLSDLKKQIKEKLETLNLEYQIVDN